MAVTGTDGPMAPWAFRAALSGLPDGEVRGILESDRCPQPQPEQDHTIAETGSDELRVFCADEKEMWLRSDRYVRLDDRR